MSYLEFTSIERTIIVLQFVDRCNVNTIPNRVIYFDEQSSWSSPNTLIGRLMWGASRNLATRNSMGD